MGQDIHQFYEEHRKGVWEPFWKPVPHPRYWWEDIANLILEPYPDDLISEANADRIEAYFQNLPTDQIEEVWGCHPKMIYDFKGKRFKRDYAYQDAVTIACKNRTWPDDVSPKIQNEAKRLGDEAHSFGWVLISELLSDPFLANFPQTRYAAEIFSYPEHTRMLFFYDC